MEFIQDTLSSPLTPMDESRNPWWKAIKKASENIGASLEVEIFPAGTDSRFLRQVGIPALGISPMRNTEVLLHDHNEFLNENVLLDGIKWYEAILQEIGNVSISDELAMPSLI